MAEIIIGGVHKCGTTALHQYLQRHPQIVAGEKKELHFFDDQTIDWNKPNYRSYEDKFPNYVVGLKRLDATPSYIYLPHCLERLQEYKPDARLIFIFRDPIERAWSHWSMRRQRGVEALSFDDAIRAEEGRLLSYSAEDIGYKEYAYVDRGRYGRQLQRALGLFARDQVLCLASELLRYSPGTALARIATHLDIEPFPAIAPIEVNTGPGNPIRMMQRTKQLIYAALVDEIRQFSELSGLDTSAWPILQRKSY